LIKTGRHGIEICLRLLVGIVFRRLAGNRERQAAGACRGQSGRDRDIQDSGDDTDAFLKLAVNGTNLIRIRRAFVLNWHAEGEHVVAANAEVKLGKIPETAEDEAGAADENQGQSKFRNDQHAAQLTVADTGGRRASAFLEHVTDILASGVPGRKTAEEDAAEKRSAQGEKQNGNAEVRIGFVRNAQLIAGHQAHHTAEQGDREESSKSAAHQRQRETFDEKLPEDARATGALRGAHGNFLLARSAPGKQEICDVDASNQKHESHGAHHEPETEAGVFRKKIVFQRLNGDGEVLIGLGIGGGEILGDDGHRGVGGFDGDALSEARQDGR
jgi:hypothetical protein